MRIDNDRFTTHCVVVDQNCLGIESVMADLLGRARERREPVALTDMAMFEMMKSEHWDVDSQRSLRFAATYPAGVVVAEFSGDLIRRERVSGTPQLDVIAPDLSSGLRRVLHDMANGGGVALDGMRSLVPDARVKAIRQFADHGQNKKRVVQMMNAWRHLAPAMRPDVQKRLKQLEHRREQMRSLLASPELKTLIEAKLKEEGWSESVSAGPSVTNYQFLAFVAVGLWYFANGWGDRTAENATNDLADLEYVLIALFCRALVSNDSKLVCPLYEDLTAAIRARS